MAVVSRLASPINIKGVSKSVSTAKKSLNQTTNSFKQISEILVKKTKVRRQIFDDTLETRRKRENYTIRKEEEDRLEAPNAVKSGDPSQVLPLIQSSGRSFFGRIISTLGYLAAGWVLRNLPTWVALGREFIVRVEKAGNIIKNFVSNTINVFTSTYQVLDGFRKNIMTFDLFDDSNRVKNSFDELKTSIDNMGIELENAIKLVTTPLTQTAADGTQVGTYSGEEVPGLGTTSQDNGAYEQQKPSSGAVSGAYDIASKIGANRQQWDIYRNTLAQIESGGRYDVPGGSGKHYDGRYQMGAAAKKDAARILGIPYPGHSDDPNHPSRVAFRKNPELQEKMFAAYTLANHGYLSSNSKYQGKQTAEQKLQVLGYAHNQGAGGAAKWLNTGIVGKDGFDTKGTRYSDALAKNFRGKVNPYPDSYSPQKEPSSGVIPQQSALPKLPPTGTGGKQLSSAQQYGAYREGGRKHAGQDFDAGPNDTFYSRIGGQVKFIGYDAKGYFNYVDIYNPQLNVTERIAEGDVILVKKDQQINPGTPVARGTKTTGVFHYEIRKGSSTTYGFEGTVNPIQFLQSAKVPSPNIQAPTSANPSTPAPYPAQISPTFAQQNQQQVAQQITPERRGQDVVAIIPQQQAARSPQSAAPASSAGGGSSAPSMFDVLNNFMKQKLLLDLAYL